MCVGLLAGFSQEDDLPTAPLGDRPQRTTDLTELYGRRDARADSWGSEQIESAVREAFGVWTSGLAAGETPQPATVDGQVVVTGRLEGKANTGPGLSVERAVESPEELRLGFRAALDRALGLPEERGGWKVSVKTTAAKDIAGRWETEHVVEGTGAWEGELLERHARWRCEWQPTGETDSELQLRRIMVLEQSAGRSERKLFAEVTGAVFEGVESFEEQLTPGLEHWTSRVDRGLGMTLIGHEGIAVRDVDGDGLEDIYLPQPGGLPNRLYLRQPDGRVKDASASSGLDFLDPSRSALFVDFDNDGDADLAVDLESALGLFENDGHGKFRERARFDLGSTTSLAAADIDLDGDLDLYACGYILPDEAQVVPAPYFDANNGRPNTLLRNDISGEDWAFSDATAEVGLDENNRRFSFAASFEDLDADGDPDLYVANDFGRNNLFVNDGGRFRDHAARAGVEDVAAGMGVSFADVDRDGDFDLHVSNMFSSAGERVVADEQFSSVRDGATLGAYRRHARGNSLFLANGDGTFEDASGAAGVTLGRWSWGAVFCELNNDGWPDLFVPNGFVTGRDPDDL